MPPGERGAFMAIKIAYICICHADSAFIARTAKALQYENDGFFIHVDNKQDVSPFKTACSGLDNVRFVENRTDVYWGGFHSIIATMRTLQLALATDDYDRFVLLQGQDYPLYSPKEIHAFFEAQPDTEFCRARNISASADRKDYMKCCGLWLMDMSPAFPVKYVRALLHRFNTLGIRYRSSRFREDTQIWDIYHGWAQFALTQDCIKYVLSVYENNTRYNRYMKNRFPPDEIYIHTIIHNSPFRDRVPKNVVVNQSGEEIRMNLTYFEYPSHVIVFTDRADYQKIRDSGYLFVRKVNSASSELLDEIDRHFH